MENSRFFDTRIDLNPTTLRAVRVAKRISCKTVSKACNVLVMNVHKWENGHSSPRLRDVLNICRLFQCSPRLLKEDPIKMMRKQMTDIAASETTLLIERLASGEPLNMKSEDLIKLLDKLGVFLEEDFMFEDEADLRNEAHNQVERLVP